LLRVRAASIAPDPETADLSADDGQPRRRTGQLGEDRQQKHSPGTVNTRLGTAQTIMPSKGSRVDETG
jgi:hypothetical protein